MKYGTLKEDTIYCDFFVCSR